MATPVRCSGINAMPRKCMYEDESMADFERRYRQRSDGSPGREVECELCGGVWAIGVGGRPGECRRGEQRRDGNDRAAN